MRCIVIAGILLMLAAPASAESKPSKDDLCALEGAWARVVMRARQMGQPLSQQMALSAKMAGGSREGVLAAYEVPRYASLQRQQRAVEDFANEIELACYRRE